jgi:hypothetical protein
LSEDVIADWLLDKNNEEKKEIDLKMLKTTCTDLVRKFLIAEKIIKD